MNSKERLESALQGGKPDRMPIMPIYDYAYIMNSTGHDPREYHTATAAERIQYLEEGFLRHDVDGYLVFPGTNEDWARDHVVEKLEAYWLVTNRTTGEQFRLLPSGLEVGADGALPSCGGESKVQTRVDIDREFTAELTEEEIETSRRFGPLHHLAAKYPNHHFGFQSSTPIALAVKTCGGLVEGLLTMHDSPSVFRELLDRWTAHMCARMAPGRKAGGRSTLFTSYYTGADTISPRDYGELVFPLELEVCRAAKAEGLFVLHWFLGDLMPILDKVMELPIDALVLEQGRKTYDIDPVEIRKRVGSSFCLFGFGFENDFVEFNRQGLCDEIARQIEGAGQEGAFVAGTPIMPPNAAPQAVDFYFSEARRLGHYSSR